MKNEDGSIPISESRIMEAMREAQLCAICNIHVGAVISDMRKPFVCYLCTMEMSEAQ